MGIAGTFWITTAASGSLNRLLLVSTGCLMREQQCTNSKPSGLLLAGQHPWYRQRAQLAPAWERLCLRLLA
jgi:hypothetical protein